jgi:polyferredoxin
MTKVKLPTGLIRYASYNGILKSIGLKLTPRIAAYSSVLVVLLLVLLIMLFTRSDIETTILRMPGMLYQETNQGTITNLYNIKIVNKTFEKLPIQFKLKQPQGKINMIGGNMMIPASKLAEAAFFVEIDKKNIFATSIPIVIGVYSENKILEEVNTTFLGPNLKTERNNEE